MRLGGGWFWSVSRIGLGPLSCEGFLGKVRSYGRRVGCCRGMVTSMILEGSGLRIGSSMGLRGGNKVGGLCNIMINTGTIVGTSGRIRGLVAVVPRGIGAPFSFSLTR